MDLGQAWKRLTGLPFVFATWLCPAEPSPAQARRLDRLARTLAAQRRINAGRIPRIVARHAAARGWPEPLAQHYLGSLLKYDVGPPQLRAMQRFWDLAHRHGLTHHRRPLRLFETSPTTGPPPRTPSALPIG
jgi:chorismate dehydratase